MTDTAQSLEELVEELTAVQKKIGKLTTASVSGKELRKGIENLYKKKWLPVSTVLANGSQVDAEQMKVLNDGWDRLEKLCQGFNPKTQYKPVLKSLIATTTKAVYAYIKSSGIQTSGDSLRKIIQGVTEPNLMKYLDESIRCAEANCVKASVVLAWCAVAHTIHRKMVSLGLPQLQQHFDAMKASHAAAFKKFTNSYTISTEPDIQEIGDRHLLLLCRFLTYFDDTQLTRITDALDLRNGCGHPTGYEPDHVNLQSFYSDITQLVLLNQKFA